MIVRESENSATRLANDHHLKDGFHSPFFVFFQRYLAM